jgi:transcriptional regulator with XRE-family HTH domain
MKFGDKLKFLRKQRKVTLQQLADHLNVSQPYISKLEKKVEPPSSMEVIEKLSDVLSVETIYFFDSNTAIRLLMELDKESKQNFDKSVIDEYTFGEVLKSFREYKEMSLKELADNICTVEELISFEKGSVYPTLDTCFQLAMKLNVELTYILEIISKTNINYPIKIMKIIDRYKRERNYEAVYNIVRIEQKNPLFSQLQLKQYLLWHLGICTFYVEKDFDKAIELLYQAIELTNPSKKNLYENEIEILTSIALLFYDTQEYQVAMTIFMEVLADLDKLPNLCNSLIKLKILFGLSQSLTELGEYQQSISYCEKGIELCTSEEKLFLLLEFHYQLGENYAKLGECTKANDNFNKCLFLLKLERKEKLYEIIEKEIAKQLQNMEK